LIPGTPRGFLVFPEDSWDSQRIPGTPRRFLILPE